MKKIVVVNHPKDWNLDIENVDVVSVKSYLTDPAYHDLTNVRVFNLSRNYWYQSSGYYVSLLAEARGHKVIPSVTTIQDLKYGTLVRALSDELDDLIQKKLAKLKGRKFALSIYFGKNMNAHYDELAQKLYGLFQAPLLRAQFVRPNGHWVLQNVNQISMKEVPPKHDAFLQKAAESYFSKSRYDGYRSSKLPLDLAILVNPEEAASPSDKRAIQKFIDAGERAGFYVDLITKDDYDKVPEYDALFIRETTAMNHHTYRFARTAAAEGMPVIDDPESIMKCSNKVYLGELLSKAKIPTPKTVIVHSGNRDTLVRDIGSFPIVLKKPDSAFSQGVEKVSTPEELGTALDRLLDDSDLVIAQEFLPTPFDWRVGVLDGKPLFACKYFMAKKHWQIINWKNKKQKEGTFETVPISKVPKRVIDLAVRSSLLIGKGLYGVDLKQVGNKVYVIEVNDNPNIDAGVEDQIEGDRVYDAIIGHLRTQIDEQLASSV